LTFLKSFLLGFEILDSFDLKAHRNESQRNELEDVIRNYITCETCNIRKRLKRKCKITKELK
jgi:hypothetical protein